MINLRLFITFTTKHDDLFSIMCDRADEREGKFRCLIKEDHHVPLACTWLCCFSEPLSNFKAITASIRDCHGYMLPPEQFAVVRYVAGPGESEPDVIEGNRQWLEDEQIASKTILNNVIRYNKYWPTPEDIQI